MKHIAIITGASSGIGKRFAETLPDQIKVDEIWAIARRLDRLEELQQGLSIPVKPISMDLADRSSYATLSALLQEEKPQVDWLIHCSGYGKFGATMDYTVEQHMDMMDLNCGATMAMNQTVIPYMKKGGHIVNIASVAAFQPIPYINVYAATKAFVLSFCRGLNRELKPQGITVTAVCPFWTKTEFFNRAIAKDTDAVVKKYTAMYTTDQIVNRAWRDAKKGKDVSKFGFVARFQALLAKLFPHSFVMSYWMNQQKLPK